MEEWFAERVSQLRRGDEPEAAEWVCREFHRLLRHSVRRTMEMFQLDRHLEAEDICQAAYSAFFRRMREGAYQLNEPKDILRILRKIAYNEVYNQYQHLRAARRDAARTYTVESEQLGERVVDASPTPSRIVAGDELYIEIHRRLPPQAKYLFQRRAEGVRWSEIAQELQQSAEALRKELARALYQVGRELGLRSKDHSTLIVSGRVQLLSELADEPGSES